MTPRENFLHFFNKEPFEWIPTNCDRVDFCPELYPDNVARGLVFQQESFPAERFGGKDMFGVEWKYDTQAKGSMEVRPPF